MSTALPRALAVLASSIALLPWSSLAWPGRLLGWFFGDVLRVRRRAMRAAAARAGLDAPDAVVAGMYRQLGRSIVELLWLAGAPAERAARAVASFAELAATERDVLRAAMARGPLVIAASHTGNWELGAFALADFLAREGRSLAVVVKPIHVRGFQSFCTKVRERFGLTLVAPRGALGAARAHLAAGGVVAMVIDQVPDRAEHGVRVDFLGASALADRAPAALARAVHGTLVVTAVEREGAVQRLRVLDVIDATARTTTTAEAMTRRATAALERFVLRAPQDWMWLHRRWRMPKGPSAHLPAAKGGGDARRPSALLRKSPAGPAEGL